MAPAPYCWRCFAPRPRVGGTAPPSQPVATTTATSAPNPSRPAPAPSSNAASGYIRPPTPPRMRFDVATPVRRRRPKGLAIPGKVQSAVALIAVIVIAAGVLRSPPYRMPESVGGSVRLLLPADAAVESGWRNALAEAGMDGDVGLYGANGSPEFMVFAYSDNGTSARGALGKLSSGFGQATGTIVGLSSSNVHTREGAEYACAPFSGGSFTAMCTWVDRGYVGSVASINDGQGVTLQRAVQARSALSAGG